MPFSRLQDHRVFKSDKLAKNGIFSDDNSALIDLYCAHPGQSQPVHGHPHATKCYVIQEGRARVTIGDEIRDLEKGDVAFAPKGVAHGIQCLGPDDLVALVFISGQL